MIYINSVCIFFLNFGHSENRFIGIRTFERSFFFFFISEDSDESANSEDSG